MLGIIPPRPDAREPPPHRALFSFSWQGDMGALGPIGYPGPKGVKVNQSHPLIGVCSQPGTP